MLCQIWAFNYELKKIKYTFAKNKSLNYTKNLVIFSIISIYFVGMLLTFSGNLIQRIQSVRFQNQIEKIANSKNLEFSLKEWNSFEGANEIAFKNQFYDVVSFKKIDSKIIANVVPDKFENEVRIFLTKILSKTKSSLPEKKKSNSFSKHILSKNEFICPNKKHFYDYKLPIYNSVDNCKTSAFINFQEKPPC